jgi:hypothetical protein
MLSCCCIFDLTGVIWWWTAGPLLLHYSREKRSVTRKDVMQPGTQGKLKQLHAQKLSLIKLARASTVILKYWKMWCLFPSKYAKRYKQWQWPHAFSAHPWFDDWFYSTKLKQRKNSATQYEQQFPKFDDTNSICGHPLASSRSTIQFLFCNRSQVIMTHVDIRNGFE